MDLSADRPVALPYLKAAVAVFECNGGAVLCHVERAGRESRSRLRNLFIGRHPTSQNFLNRKMELKSVTFLDKMQRYQAPMLYCSLQVCTRPTISNIHCSPAPRYVRP